MILDEFLDINIVINYINYNKNSKKIIKNSYEYLKNIKGEIILCGFAIIELNNYIKKKTKIHNSILKKMKNIEYNLSENLKSREVAPAKKLYVLVKNKNLEEVSEFFAKERILFEIKVDKFLKFRLNKVVINSSDIDKELVNKIHELISNIDDCKILASALQYNQQNINKFNFVTTDDDFDINGYAYLKEHFKINYSKEKYKFPNLINLLH